MNVQKPLSRDISIGDHCKTLRNIQAKLSKSTVKKGTTGSFANLIRFCPVGSQ
jgi:hypothetical protein